SPEQLNNFADEISAVGKRITSKLGNKEDERFLRRVKSGNLSCEIIGRSLIHISFEPITFLLGVFFLSTHFNLEVTLAHNSGHGAFNRLRDKKGLSNYSSKTYAAKNLPASIEGWKFIHNKLHHVHCNIIGKDPDIGYELFRVSELQGTPTNYQRFQLIILFIMSLPLMIITGLRTYEYKAVKAGEEKTIASLLLDLLTGSRYFLVNLVVFPILAC
ncbi:unnamed protein product, partial [Hapterophycus canaliculatus]